MRYRVVNLGCKVNRVESDGFERRLSEIGGERAEEGSADLVVVNTCTVTGVAEKKTRKAVRHSLNANPEATVVVTGCAAVQNPSLYEGMSPRAKVVAKWDMEEFIGSLGASGPHGAPAAEPDGPRPFLSMGRARVGVKAQDGCANECTYCIVHKLRGPELSIAPGEVLRQSLKASEAGAAEIVLTGINLGRYDHKGLRLAGLLEALLSHDGIRRIRLSSIEPDNLDDELIDLMAASDGRVCRHLHLPMQSGSSKVLSEMARKYSAGFFRDLVACVRARMPSVSVSTDVIAGFPGETERDFEDTYRLCEECGFSKMHVFPYSERAGTPAAERTDQVPREVRLKRAESLRELGGRLRRQDLEARRGTTELAVVEDDVWCTTESYHAVKRPEGSSEGALVEVRL